MYVSNHAASEVVVSNSNKKLYTFYNVFDENTRNDASMLTGKRRISTYKVTTCGRAKTP